MTWHSGKLLVQWRASASPCDKGSSFDGNQRGSPRAQRSSLFYFTISSDSIWVVGVGVVVGEGGGSSSSCLLLCLIRPCGASLERSVQQHKDQGYSGAAGLPSADRKGLMMQGHSSLVIRNNVKNYFCVCSYGVFLTLRPAPAPPPSTQTHTHTPPLTLSLLAVRQ